MRYFLVNEIEELHGHGRKKFMKDVARIMFKVNPRHKPVELYKVKRNGELKLFVSHK